MAEKQGLSIHEFINQILEQHCAERAARGNPECGRALLKKAMGE